MLHKDYAEQKYMQRVNFGDFHTRLDWLLSMKNVVPLKETNMDLKTFVLDFLQNLSFQKVP